MSSSPVLSAEQRAWQYWFDDGLPTIVSGIGCLLGALFFAYDHSENSTLVTITICFVALVLYGAVLLFQRQIIDWLKERITYPRTGYAQAPYFAENACQPLGILAIPLQGKDADRAADLERLQKYRKQRLILTCIVVSVAAAAMMFIRDRWVCALAGIVMAAGLWIWGRKVQRLSWLILGGFPFIGFLLGLFVSDRVPGSDRVTYFLFAAGTLFVLDGALALLRYLRSNPRAPQPQP